MKTYKIIGVDKNGSPIEEKIKEFDEHAALIEFDEIFDPMNEQHYKRERWDRWNLYQ